MAGADQQPKQSQVAAASYRTLSKEQQGRLLAAITERIRLLIGVRGDIAVLVEYISVMLQSEKHRDLMEDELEAFLQEHTQPFVAWLTQQLEQEGRCAETTVESAPSIHGGSAHSGSASRCSRGKGGLVANLLRRAVREAHGAGVPRRKGAGRHGAIVHTRSATSALRGFPEDTGGPERPTKPSLRPRQAALLRERSRSRSRSLQTQRLGRATLVANAEIVDLCDDGGRGPQRDVGSQGGRAAVGVSASDAVLRSLSSGHSVASQTGLRSSGPVASQGDRVGCWSGSSDQRPLSGIACGGDEGSRWHFQASSNNTGGPPEPGCAVLDSLTFAGTCASGLRSSPPLSCQFQHPVPLAVAQPRAAFRNVAPQKWRVVRGDTVVSQTQLLESSLVRTLNEGEIVESVGPPFSLPNGVVRIEIAHPASALYPNPVGWVTLDASAVGGPRHLEPGPQLVQAAMRPMRPAYGGWRPRPFRPPRFPRPFAGYANVTWRPSVA